MMTMRKALFILLLLSAFAAWSCRKELGPEAVASGNGSIELKLNSGNAVTLQTKANDLEEGLKFNNVLVILVNNSGIVVGNVYKTYPYTPGVDDIQDAESDTSVAEDVIHFNGLLPGNYQVYAYANIDASAWQSGNLIATQEKVAAVGSSFSALADRELAALTGTGVPSNPSSSMLLTGQKEVAVGLTRVSETLDLLRPVVRFKVSVRNHTPFPVKVDELRFSHFNPDKAYLLDHRDDSGVPSLPSGVTYRAMPAFDTTAGDDDTVASDTVEVVYQRLIYENAYSKPYKIFAAMTLDRSSESLSDLQLSLGDRPFGVIDYTTLNGMDVGEQVDVLLINPRKQTRSARLYYRVSAQDNYAWESCGYDGFNKLFARASAIFGENPSFGYVGFTYNGAGSNNSGLAGWTGLDADAPLGPPNNSTVTFNYTGANSGNPRKYFRTLSRNADGLFSIDGLSSSATSLTGMRVEQGTISDSNRFPPDLQAGNLVNFIQNSTGKNLKSDCMYSESDVNKAKKSKLVWDTARNQDHQFILFGKYMAGGPLKRILKDNNKEVPLTYMARNEEINVVINVYYSDTEGTLDFVVDNSTWKTATTVTHTFK
jgi:hypothetical protein